EDEARKYATFLYTNIAFLPKNTPEELVWDDSSAKELCTLLNVDFPSQIVINNDFKEKIKILADDIPGYDPNSIFSHLLAKFFARNDELNDEINSILNDIRLS
ncbi:MAG: hypothetical protein RLZZ490_850, partial [Cyanobacteriota bacterium]